MDAKQIFINDIRGVVNVNVDKTMGAAAAMSGKYPSASGLVESKFWASLNAQSEFAVLSAFSALADAQGRSRLGLSSKADDILAEQANRIRSFKEKAYRLSERQSIAVIEEAFAWIGGRND